jgi:dihydropteroate synthase
MSLGALVRGLPAIVAPDSRLYLKQRRDAVDRDLELIVRDGTRIERYPTARATLDRWLGTQPATIILRVQQLLAHLGPTANAGPPAKIRIMGVVNVTPDSFSDGGDHATPDAAIAHGLKLIEEGADIIDVGGESTRPGARAPTLDDELARVLPVVRGLAGRAPLVSIDSRRAAVMGAALAAGAGMINDVSALTHDPAALGVAARHDVPVVLMHMQGTPEMMQRAPRYDCAPLDIFDYLETRIAACEAAGIARARLIVDPGIGFGKTVQHNLEILRDLAVLKGLGCPIMVGVSRKGFIGRLTATKTAKDRLPGSLAATLYAIFQGAEIVRVHDVAATRQAITLWGVLEL